MTATVSTVKRAIVALTTSAALALCMGAGIAVAPSNTNVVPVAHAKSVKWSNKKVDKLGDCYATTGKQIKKVKLSGRTLTIKAKMRHNNDGKACLNTWTLKIVKHPKSLSGEDYWYCNGKSTPKALYRVLKTSKKHDFPTVYLWIKNRQIVAYGQSA